MLIDIKALMGTLLASPERVSEVPVEAIPGRQAQVLQLQAALTSRLLMQSTTNQQPARQVNSDRLLSAEEVAKVLGVTKRWLYSHAGQLSFTRRLTRKALRFSEDDLQRYMAAKRP